MIINTEHETVFIDVLNITSVREQENSEIQLFKEGVEYTINLFLKEMVDV